MKKETEEVTRKDEEKNKKGKEERRFGKIQKEYSNKERKDGEGGRGGWMWEEKIKRGVREEKRTME